MNLEEMSESIREQFTGMEKKINDLTKQKGNERQESATKVQKRLNGVKNLINHYKFAIDEGDDQDGIDSHKSQLKQFQLKYDKLQKKIDFVRNQNVKEDDLFKHRKEQEDVKKMDNNRQVVIQKGHDVQKESKDAVNRMKKNMHQMEEKANQIGIQLDRQINQLDGIYDNMKQTETTLKRAEVHLRYFARQVYTDRLMICLIVVIVLAIITIIILKIVGLTPEADVDNLKRL